MSSRYHPKVTRGTLKKQFFETFCGTLWAPWRVFGPTVGPKLPSQHDPTWKEHGASHLLRQVLMVLRLYAAQQMQVLGAAAHSRNPPHKKRHDRNMAFGIVPDRIRPCHIISWGPGFDNPVAPVILGDLDLITPPAMENRQETRKRTHARTHTHTHTHTFHHYSRINPYWGVPLEPQERSG